MLTEKKTILLTGASGFIGQRFVQYNENLYNIVPISLRDTSVDTIDFRGIDTIVHAAGIAHQMSKISNQIYFDINTELTKKLALAAKNAGVSHFIFLSTIKTFGEHQKIILNEDSPCHPLNDPYGQSKLEAEKYLQSIENAYFTVSILRPPLVYGPGVKGNLIKLLKLADSNNLLPFAGIDNRRSMIFLDNLMALLNVIISKKKSGIFLATDDKPISTTYLLSEIRKNLGRRNRLFSFPSLIRWSLSIIKPEMYIRLYDSLEMNSEKTFQILDFKPPYSIEEGIKSMVDHYKNSTKID